MEPLYSAKVLTGPFLAAANVGLFYCIDGEPIVPDVIHSALIVALERRAWEMRAVPKLGV